MELKNKKCIPCTGEIPPLKKTEKLDLLKKINSNWQFSEDQKKLLLVVDTKDFATSLELANKIGEEADRQWHHPKLIVEFRKLRIEMWTHKINDLVESDFIFAAKIDQILLEYKGG